MILGVMFLITAYGMPTSLPPYSALENASDVINIGLLQDQLMVWQLGLAAFLTGGLLFAAGSVLESCEKME